MTLSIVYNEADPVVVVGIIYILGSDGMRRQAGRIQIDKAQWDAFRGACKEAKIELRWGFN